jgi:hypothetical protein
VKHSFKNKSEDCDPKYNFDLKMDNKYDKNDSQELNRFILSNHSSLSEYFNTIENDTIEEIQIPHLQSLNPPQTAHVFVNLSTDKYNSKLNVKALHYSGCAKSIIHSKVFQKIPNVEQLTIHSLPNIIFLLAQARKQTFVV